MPVAETLGVVGSIIAIVQISKTIISCCHFYIDVVDGAQPDLRVILIEVSTLKGIAESLQYLTQPHVASSILLEQLVTVTGPVEGCKKALKELETLFPPAVVSANGQRSKKRRKLDAALTALAWPLKAGKAKKLLQEIMQHKTTINLALTAEFVQDLKDVKRKAEKIQDLLNESKRRDVYKWLETTDASTIHNRSRKLYEPHTASWMLRTPEWPLWIQGKHRCLWVHGIPGAGKSILASYLAEEVEEHCKSSSNDTSQFGHAYYYCYFGHDQDESSHFLRWIIGQLCRQSERVPEELHDMYNSGKAPTPSSLLSILPCAMARFKRVYIVLDAIDESMPRGDLLRVIHVLATAEIFASLSLLVTSRHYIDIVQVLETCSIPITMANPFRWAVCQLDTLRRLKPDVSTIRAALSNLPKTLDETYERIFLAIPEDDWPSVQHIFHWLVYHEDLFGTGIQLSTLLQAVQQSTRDFLSSDADPLHDFEGLHELCGCLIMIEQKETPKCHHNNVYHPLSTVSFAHYTVKEYLQSPRFSEKRVGFFALAQERIQKHFAGIALRQALAIQPGELADFDQMSDKTDIQSSLTSDFRLYCGVSSALQLNIWSEAISSDSTLMELCTTLVDPCRPAHRDLVSLLTTVTIRATNVTRNLGFDEGFHFWSIAWEQTPDPDSVIFLIFLIISGFSDIPHLAHAFARSRTMLPILKQRLKITRSAWFAYQFGSYCFSGSIPELVAQWAWRQQGTFNFILDLISENGENYFDLSTLLLLCTCSHDHTYCGEDKCPLERLLHLGANADGPEGAYVTPLQISVVTWDLQGTEMLLNAGAKPNALGATGSRWAPNSIMSRFNTLHGASPLHIIKHLECIYAKDIRCSLELGEIIRDKIEARLLVSGAMEIEPRCSELGCDIVSDETDGYEEDIE
ncbi:Nn.00g084300.m01.CDS01 [Neocucurbitaria sp. VM-36]